MLCQFPKTSSCLINRVMFRPSSIRLTFQPIHLTIHIHPHSIFRTNQSFFHHFNSSSLILNHTNKLAKKRHTGRISIPSLPSFLKNVFIFETLSLNPKRNILTRSIKPIAWSKTLHTTFSTIQELNLFQEKYPYFEKFITL